jgi:hypothetical protein
MNRRDFTTLSFGAALAGLSLPAGVWAQGIPVEGRQYVNCLLYTSDAADDM